MSDQFVLAIDQGTTGTTVTLFDRESQMVAKVYAEFTQHYPKPGWVEHDAQEIWEGTKALLNRLFQEAGIKPAQVAAIGVTNQRETVVLWDRQTGEPVTRAIVWQCRRTAGICDELRSQGLEPVFQEKPAWCWTPIFLGLN